MTQRKQYNFDSWATFTQGTEMPAFSQHIVKNEPQFFSATPMFAMKAGGPITETFLDLVNRIWVLPSDAIFDSRVHMLMPGWWPCVPGWHHDDVPRTRADGQPNYDTPEYKAEHVMALVNGDICPTEFALGEGFFNEILPGEGPIYSKWHKAVEYALEIDHLKLVKAPTGKLIRFGNNTWHQGVRATGSGFRWFGRVSWNTHRKPVNEIRRQTQVYLQFPMEGW